MKISNLKKSTDDTASTVLKAENKGETNPWLNARNQWNGHVSGLMASVKMWQAIALASLFLALAAVGGVIHIGSQSKFIPLVFQQDASGNMLSITRADRMQEAQVDDYRTAALHFIENIRLVTADSELQRKAILKTYAFMQQGDAAITKANEFLNASEAVNPFARAVTELVHVEIQSVLLQTKDSWQVDWIETVRGRDGIAKEKYAMRAILNLYQRDFADGFADMEALLNPHLIFVRDFSWSRQR